MAYLKKRRIGTASQPISMNHLLIVHETKLQTTTGIRNIRVFKVEMN